jgi:hypothetical protein
MMFCFQNSRYRVMHYVISALSMQLIVFVDNYGFMLLSMFNRAITFPTE